MIQFLPPMIIYFLVWNTVYNISLAETSRLKYCQSNFQEACGLVQRNIHAFLATKITWPSMASHSLHYLLIDEKMKEIYVVPSNLSIHTWYHTCDIEMWGKINRMEQLPNIILPLNGADGYLTMGSERSLKPFFSYCTTNHDYVDILIPKGMYDTCGRNPHITFRVNSSEWIRKENKAWFRGTLNHGARKGRFTILNETKR